MNEKCTLLSSFFVLGLCLVGCVCDFARELLLQAVLSLSLSLLCWCSSVPLRALNSSYFIVVVVFFLGTNKHLIVSFFIF